MFAKKQRDKAGGIRVTIVSSNRGQRRELLCLGTVRSELEADALFLRAQDAMRAYGGQQALDFTSPYYSYDLTAPLLRQRIKSLYTEEGSLAQSRYHRTGVGEYAEGDLFIGLTRAQLRAIVAEVHGHIGADEFAQLLRSEYHEVRFCAFLLLAEMMADALPKGSNKGDAHQRGLVADCYLTYAPYTRGWDIVDYTAPQVIGEWLLHEDENGALPDRSILDELSRSNNLWEQRISIVSTQTLIKAGQLKDTLRLARRFLRHDHDLMHKATGWMLREVGKKDVKTLRRFLDKYAARMPRTMLRYAIERFEESERRAYMKVK